MSSAQELSSGMLACDLLACSEKQLLIKKYNSLFPFFFFQHLLMKKLSDSAADVFMREICFNIYDDSVVITVLSQ